MNDEKTLKKYIVNLLKHFGDIQRHEDKYESGIPDLSFGIFGINGWIELKHKKAWPKRATTKVKFNHFTNKQRTWLKTRGQAGGHCFVIIQISTNYLLFCWRDIDSIGNLTREKMLEKAAFHWRKKSPVPNYDIAAQKLLIYASSLL